MTKPGRCSIVYLILLQEKEMNGLTSPSHPVKNMLADDRLKNFVPSSSITQREPLSIHYYRFTNVRSFSTDSHKCATHA